MCLFESDNVKAEKANAMRGSNWRRKFQKLFPVLEAVVALSLLFWWFFSAWSLQVAAGEYLRRLAGCFNNGICIFVIVNALIIVIFPLSQFKKATESDLHYEYLSFTSAGTTAASAVAEKYPPQDNEEKYLDKQTILVTEPKEVSVSPAKPKTAHAINSFTETVKEKQTNVRKVNSISINSVGEAVRAGECKMTDLPLEDAIGGYRNARVSILETVTENHEKFQNVNSVTCTTDHRINSVGEAVCTGNRLMTDLSLDDARDGNGSAQVSVRETIKENLKSVLKGNRVPTVAVRTGGREMTDLPLGGLRNYRRTQSLRWTKMDDLSGDEFRRTVETFISAKRKTLLQETIDEGRADVAV